MAQDQSVTMRRASSTRPIALLALVVAVAVLATGCRFVLTRPGGTAGAPCFEGSWDLSGQQISDTITSLFGDLTVTPDDDGMTLVLSADDSFTFEGSQTLGVAGMSPYGAVDGTVTASVTVGGTYTDGPGTLTFTVGSLAGSGQFVGTLNGMPVNYSGSLSQLGLDEIYGLSGSAGYSCTSTQLTLDFDNVDWEF